MIPSQRGWPVGWLHLIPQIPQLRIRVDLEHVPQVDVNSFRLESLSKLHDAVPKGGQAHTLESSCLQTLLYPG